jgi:hypothetical protein
MANLRGVIGAHILILGISPPSLTPSGVLLSYRAAGVFFRAPVRRA